MVCCSLFLRLSVVFCLSFCGSIFTMAVAEAAVPAGFCEEFRLNGVIVSCVNKGCPATFPTCGRVYQTPGDPSTPVIACSCQ